MAEPRKAVRSNSGASVILTIHAVPRSSRISIAQEGPTHYKIRLTSAPVDGAANSQLIKLLSKKLSLPARSVRITSGETSRMKLIRIDGLDADRISYLLLSK